MRRCVLCLAALLIVKMSTSYKLIYFNIRGRGEVTRYLFAQAGVSYTDERVENKDWPALKPVTQYGFLPILELNGGEHSITGSLVIPRYLAERPEFKLAGANPVENAQIAAVANFLQDLEHAILKVVRAKDNKEEIAKDFSEVQVPNFFGKLEGFCSTGGYLFQDKLTWVDFYFYELYEWVAPVMPNILDDYPSLKKLTTTIENLPNIAKWMKERPKSDY